MVIDIIDYTPEQYAALTTVKLEEIRSAQSKKNKLYKELQAKLLAEKGRLMDRGVFPSNVWERRVAELTAVYEGEVETLREALLFYLRYTGNGEENKVPVGVPYPVDYSLPEEDRLLGVKEYYLGAYEDAQLRFDAFVADSFARSYLGELYAPLYHYFEDLARA